MCDYPNHVTLIPKRNRTRVLFHGSVVDYESSGVYQNVMKSEDVGVKSVLVPCGKCELCIQSRIREWRNRLVLEARLYESSYFVTFTYTDENHPVEGLLKAHMQLLFKRMRKAGLKFKYFCKGEYGPRTGRAHYHVLFFGLELNDLTSWKKSVRGDMLYFSPTLYRFWSYGMVVVGKVTQSSAYYVASYGLKKSKDDEWYGWTRNDNKLHKQNDEFFIYSKSLGYSNIMQYYDEETEKVYFDGNSFRLPRWFRRKYLVLEKFSSVVRDSSSYKNSISFVKSKKRLKNCLTDENF